LESWDPKSLRVWSRSINPRSFGNLERSQYPVKIMFWGYISFQGVGLLVPIEGTMDAESIKKCLRRHYLKNMMAKIFVSAR